MDTEEKRRDSRRARGRTEDGAPNPIDIHVGNRVRVRRTLVGISQERLAERLGLTFQQVQKYERGVNRISASRLWDMANVLEVSISYFYEGIDNNIAMRSPRMLHIATPRMPDELAEEASGFDEDPLKRRETLALVRNYYRIADRALARKIYEMVRMLAKASMPAGSPDDDSEDSLEDLQKTDS